MLMFSYDSDVSGPDSKIGINSTHFAPVLHRVRPEPNHFVFIMLFVPMFLTSPLCKLTFEGLPEKAQ